MGKHDKLKERIGSGTVDANIDFGDLCSMLSHLGFGSKQGASSHVKFFHENVREIIILQPGKSGKAKPYQVKQVREILAKYPKL